jgi:hypothetical protein
MHCSTTEVSRRRRCRGRRGPPPPFPLPLSGGGGEELRRQGAAVPPPASSNLRFSAMRCAAAPCLLKPPLLHRIWTRRPICLDAHRRATPRECGAPQRPASLSLRVSTGCGHGAPSASTQIGPPPHDNAARRSALPLQASACPPDLDAAPHRPRRTSPRDPTTMRCAAAPCLLKPPLVHRIWTRRPICLDAHRPATPRECGARGTAVSPPERLIHKLSCHSPSARELAPRTAGRIPSAEPTTRRNPTRRGRGSLAWARAPGGRDSHRDGRRHQLRSQGLR